MARDYYAEAEEIAHRLEEEGAASDGQTLRQAIAAGSTATEILMGIRWHLLRIEKSNVALQLETRRRMRDLVLAIGVVLGYG